MNARKVKGRDNSSVFIYITFISEIMNDKLHSSASINTVGKMQVTQFYLTYIIMSTKIKGHLFTFA